MLVSTGVWKKLEHSLQNQPWCENLGDVTSRCFFFSNNVHETANVWDYRDGPKGKTSDLGVWIFSGQNLEQAFVSKRQSRTSHSQQEAQCMKEEPRWGKNQGKQGRSCDLWSLPIEALIIHETLMVTRLGLMRPALCPANWWRVR